MCIRDSIYLCKYARKERHPSRVQCPLGRTIPDGWYTLVPSQSSIPGQKRGRPLGLKDSYPRKRRNLAQMNTSEIAILTEPFHETFPDNESVLKETSVDGEVVQLPIPENQEISVRYACLDEI